VAQSRDGIDLARHPIAQTAFFLGVAVLAFILLSLEQGSGDLVRSDEWLTWKGTAAVGQAVAVTLLAHGVAKLIAEYEPGERKLYGISITAASLSWPEFGSAASRCSRAIGTGPSPPWGSASTRSCSSAQPARRRGRDSLDRLPAGSSCSHDRGSLLNVWNLVTAIAQAFALFVIVAVLPTGALLNLWLAQAETPAAARGPASSL
jgi:hypothetical protein